MSADDCGCLECRECKDRARETQRREQEAREEHTPPEPRFTLAQIREAILQVDNQRLPTRIADLVLAKLTEVKP